MSNTQPVSLSHSFRKAVQTGLIFIAIFEGYILLNKGVLSVLGISNLLGGWGVWQTAAGLGAATFMLFKGIHTYYRAFLQIPTGWLIGLVFTSGLSGLLTAAFSMSAALYALSISVSLLTTLLSFLLLLIGLLFLLLRIAIVVRCLQVIATRYQLLT